MPSPSAHSQPCLLFGVRVAVFGGLVLITLIVMMGSIARNASAGQTTFQPTWYMVVDRANLLDEGQEISAINAAWQLSTGGIPAQVVTEVSASTPELANQRARELLVSNRIESAPNAGDGVLIYAAVNPDDRSEVHIGIAVGPHTLPHGGLRDVDMEDIRNSIVDVQLSERRPARAIVYALREMNYQDVFTPPSVSAPTGWQKTINRLMPILGPVVAIIGATSVWMSLREVATLGRTVLPVLGGLAVALLLGIVSVMTQSGIGMLSTATLLGAMALLSMMADRRIRESNQRALHVTPRPPGSFTSIARVQR